MHGTAVPRVPCISWQFLPILGPQTGAFQGLFAPWSKALLKLRCLISNPEESLGCLVVFSYLSKAVTLPRILIWPMNLFSKSLTLFPLKRIEDFSSRGYICPFSRAQERRNDSANFLSITIEKWRNRIYHYRVFTTHLTWLKELSHNPMQGNHIWLK